VVGLGEAFEVPKPAQQCWAILHWAAAGSLPMGVAAQPAGMCMLALQYLQPGALPGPPFVALSSRVYLCTPAIGGPPAMC
jgi:hypothetical protein